MKLKSIFLVIIINLIIFSFITFSSIKSHLTTNNEINTYLKQKDSLCVGLLSLPSINYQACLYNLEDYHNNLDYGVTILQTNPWVIVGHSGHGSKAVFNSLFKLHIHDHIIISYYHETTNYETTNIYYYHKKQSLPLNNSLFLATCSLINIHEQLIISAKKI